VIENVVEAPTMVKKMPRGEAEELGMGILEKVGVAEKRDQHPIQLSGGQKQRVAIARPHHAARDHALRRTYLPEDAPLFGGGVVRKASGIGFQASGPGLRAGSARTGARPDHGPYAEASRKRHPRESGTPLPRGKIVRDVGLRYAAGILPDLV
jgi:hypothetical protein